MIITNSLYENPLMYFKLIKYNLRFHLHELTLFLAKHYNYIIINPCENDALDFILNSI